jgi:hypothetical protein
VLTGHANATPDSLDLTVLCLNALNDALDMGIALEEFAIVDRALVVMLVRLLFAQITATITENVLMADATAEPDLEVKIAPFEPAHQTATTTDNASTTHANASMDGLDLIAHSRLALLNVLEMDTATMQPASASLDLLEFIAHFLPAHLLAQEMEDVCQSEHKWHVNATRVTRATIAQNELVQMTALDTASASVVSALVKMGGVAMIVLLAALDMDKGAVETENVLKANAIATQDGQDMAVTSEPACTTALNTDTATMELASAKKATEDVTAPSHLNHNLASVPFTVFVVAFNSAQKFMRLKVLDPRTSATQNVHRNACHSALLGRCPKTSAQLLLMRSEVLQQNF